MHVTDHSITTPDSGARGGSELLHRLVRGATEYALLLLGPDEKIVYWNEGASRIFGYTEQEALGLPVTTLFTPEDVELGVALKELQLAAEHGAADDERWHRRKDGTRFWASGVVTSVRDENGTLLGYSKVLRDQTLRKQTEDKMKSSVAELTHFHHVVAHDLQEPLRTVSCYLSLIERRYHGRVDEEHDAFVLAAQRGTQRMQTLLNDLIEFVRSESSRVERIDLSAVFDMAVSNLKVMVDETRATVTRTSLPVVEGSSSDLVRLFQNLIGNALKYRKEDVAPKVCVEAKSQSDQWLVSVSDNGIGVPPDQHARVFEAFQRAHRKKEYSGTGLGLFLCRKAVERHGGRIWLESDGKNGTRVLFTLPRTLHEEES